MSETEVKKKFLGMNINMWEAAGFVFLVLGVLLLIFTLVQMKFAIFFNVEHDTNFGNLGQYIEGFVGSLWNMASIMLFYAALKYQKDELSQQGDHLAQQLNEFHEQTEQQKRQNVTLEEQKVETTFFQMLRFHNEIIPAIEMEVNKYGLPSKDDPEQNIKIAGRKCFVEYFKNYKIYFNSYLEDYMSEEITEEVTYELINRSYDSFFEEYQSDLGHYFRNLLNLIRFVDTHDVPNKKFYIDLVRSQLSNYELLLLFFHCLSHNGNEFKPLIEKYAILASLPDDEIINLTRELYAPTAFEIILEEEEENKSEVE